MTDQPTRPLPTKPPRRKRGWKLLRRGLVLLVFIPTFLFLLFQWQPLQDWLTKRVTNAISTTLESRVEVEKVRISWFDELTIDSLFIEDKYGDTLLYGQTIRVDFDVLGGISVNEVLIADTKFQIRRRLGDPASNLETALSRLFPPKDEPGGAINLKLGQVDLQRVTFIQNDSVKGQRFDVSLNDGVIRMKDLDLPNKVVAVSSIVLREPLVTQTSIPPSPIDSALLRLDSLVRQADTSSLRFLTDNLEIINGGYTLNNYRKEEIAASDISAVDFARLGIKDINIELVDAQLYKGDFTGKLNNLSLEEKSGFVLDQLSVQDLKITPTELQLYDLKLITPQSSLSDSLRFTFREGWNSWSAFNDKVRMDIRVKNSSVAIRDILYFARKLRFNQFFRDNISRQVVIGGHFRRNVNNLRADDIFLALDNRTKMRGSFGSRNLAKPGSEALDFNLDRLDINVNTLRRLIPSFRPPENFNQLGNLVFSGVFEGTFADYIYTKGSLQTDIGRTDLDLTVLFPDYELPAYSGALALDQFDLGAWTGNPDFGLVTFDGRVENGRGFEAANASADLAATIRDFNFKGYTYRNAVIDGRLEEKFFNGSFQIVDSNIDFNFTGEVDFRDSIPTFDFDAAIAELDLEALNLTKKPLSLAGAVDLNLQGTNFSEMEGQVFLEDFTVYLDTVAVDIDSLLAYSAFNPSGEKVVKLESDIAAGEIIGTFDLDEVSTSLTGYIVRYYPQWAQRLNIRKPRREPAPNRFSFDLLVKDSRGLNRLLTPKLGRLRDLSLSGGYDGYEDTTRIQLISPEITFDDFTFRDILVTVGGKTLDGDIDLIIGNTDLKGQPFLNRVTLLSLVNDGIINFGLAYGGDEDNILLDRIDLDGTLSLPDSLNYQLTFDESELQIFKQRWNIRRDNALVFGPKYINAENFSIRSGKRQIQLNNFGEEGLDLDLLNVDLSLIDSVWNYQQLDFSGDLDINVSVRDVFRQEDISAKIRSDSFFMNGDDYGYLAIDLTAPNPKSQLTAYMNLNRDTAQLIAEATFNLADLVDSDPAPPQRKNFLDLGVRINGYPLDIGRYWVGGSVSDISGLFNARLDVRGPTNKLDVSGYIDALSGAFTIDYLQTRYKFYQSRVRINNSLFDLGGTKLIDRLGNSATLSGGVTHNRLKNLGLDAQINTDRFLALELLPGQNPQFFGTAVGGGSVFFTGNFRQPDIYVRATVGRDSKLSIPVDYSSEAGRIDDVRFVNRTRYIEEQDKVATAPTGVSLTMDLTVTEEAVGEIIFDEEVGDILQGSGNGNLQLNIPRDGDLEMFGVYNITEGNYLFTLQKIINKEFAVRPGGTVSWTGDPFEATLDIEADYKNLKAPILPFIQEYLIADVNEDLTNLASEGTEIDLTLELDGLLTKPNINFNIRFPELDGTLESYANNKRRLLLQNQNELNRQVFGLIVAGQFLPSDLSFGISDVAVNTLSEWLSNYLSLLINDLVKNAFGEDAFISKFEFDLAYNTYRNSTLSRSDGRNSALEFSVSRDVNNRLTIRGDVSVVNSQLANTGALLGNDFVLEYVLNDSRSLKLRLYQRYEPDITSGSRFKIGTGLSWRREFDTFREFFAGLRKDSKSLQQ